MGDKGVQAIPGIGRVAGDWYVFLKFQDFVIFASNERESSVFI